MIMNRENTISVKIQDTKENRLSRPKVYLKSITFNDDTQLELEPGNIIVFTGANNSGKSQVLKDIEINLDPSYERHGIVAKNIIFDYYGKINDSTFLKENFVQSDNGGYQLLGVGSSFKENILQEYWKNHTLYSGLDKLFVKRLNTEARMFSSNALNRSDLHEKHPIYKLNKSEQLVDKISNLFHQAFGVDLVLNSNEMKTIPLHIGQAPDKKSYTMDRKDEYYSQVGRLPKLEEQGDGMRSFASILLDIFTSEYSITLIDEPEAFLHPPQARIIGKMLAQNNPENRQLFISTHSEDFLQGLVDADNKNVIVIRIDREKDINRMRILESNKIKKLWGNPIMRYSNILSGLFHEKVVVCESDYDCLFYQALIDAIYENRGEISPDIFFTHCGGKSRVKDIVSALRAVGVPVVAICDFDLLNSSSTFKPLVKAFGLDWETELAKDMKVVYDTVNSQSNVSWDILKNIGKHGLPREALRAYENVEATCKSNGLFIVPVGEMEDFDKTLVQEKKEWVYKALEVYNLASEEKLEGARQFVQSIIDYKL